ncbi:hypothetical protein AVEN_105025-1 [Araneus ventricosus]|uniref:Uncharacterized protein n=1 Tax=Araneus ventricosus TaxID=182803 RepID=A0A4Y2GF19_ARAVE|nr:hypothetical protein AVEN_105025-1 [Araneus ventricosus]
MLLGRKVGGEKCSLAIAGTVSGEQMFHRSILDIKNRYKVDYQAGKTFRRFPIDGAATDPMFPCGFTSGAAVIAVVQYGGLRLWHGEVLSRFMDTLKPIKRNTFGVCDNPAFTYFARYGNFV